MGLIKEPEDVDFFVINRKFTEKERKEMIAFIEEHKRKQAMTKKKKQRKTL